MNTMVKISFGMAALVAAGTIGFAPASVDKRNEVTSVALAMAAPVVLASPETPQDSVWDMTYGSERPSVAEESVAVDASSIVDYALG